MHVNGSPPPVGSVAQTSGIAPGVQKTYWFML
jgi:hypothetical protein